MSTQLPAFTRRYGSKFQGTVVSDVIDTADMPSGVRYLVVYLSGIADQLQAFGVRVLGAQTGFEYLNSRLIVGRGSWVGNCLILPEIDDSYTIEVNIGDRIGTQTSAVNDVVIRVAATNAEVMPIIESQASAALAASINRNIGNVSKPRAPRYASRQDRPLGSGQNVLIPAPPAGQRIRLFHVTGSAEFGSGASAGLLGIGDTADPFRYWLIVAVQVNQWEKSIPNGIPHTEATAVYMNVAGGTGSANWRVGALYDLEDLNGNPV